MKTIPISIPLPYRILMTAAFISAAFIAGVTQGKNGKQRQWDAEKAKTQIAVIEKKSDQLEKSIEVVTEYVDRVQIVKEAGKTIVKEIPVYVKVNNDHCMLPAGFRLLHDAAATNTVPDPSRIANEAAVDAATVAETVAENYATCNEIREQLVSLQRWAVESR